MSGIKAIDEAGEITALLQRVTDGPFGLEELGQLVQWTRRWLGLRVVLEEGKMSLKELKKILLGIKDHDDKAEDRHSDPPGPPDPPDPKQEEDDKKAEKKPKRKGHGRKSAKEYKGCRRHHVYPRHRHGDPCPDCVGKPGRLSHYKPGRPQTRLRLTGGAPITGTVYHGHLLYCSRCGTRFDPDWPEDASRETYDASAKAMIALMRHWYGFPSYRLEKLQQQLGIPVPDSTQADLIREGSLIIEPAFHALFRQAARARIFILDDTTARIQDVVSERKKNPGQNRYGAHVTGIIARDQRDIYIYRVGTQHAGENFDDLLLHRPQDMEPPLQMSDALAANTDHSFQTIVSYCLNHARGNIADIEDHFPAECRKILAIFSQVFKNEAHTKKHNMDEQQRLRYHQQHSRQPMEQLFAYLDQLLSLHLFEENSPMDKAARYMLKRKKELTRFLQIAGAPLDSNAVERALKYAVLIRKNSLFYRNELTAYQACLFMSLAATAVHNGADPLHYLTALIDNEARVKANPDDWLPWNYQDHSPSTPVCSTRLQSVS